MIENTRIVIDPQICHGSQCVRGLRYSVAMILALLASGMSHSEILVDYAYHFPGTQQCAGPCECLRLQ